MTLPPNNTGQKPPPSHLSLVVSNGKIIPQKKRRCRQQRRHLRQQAHCKGYTTEVLIDGVTIILSTQELKNGKLIEFTLTSNLRHPEVSLLLRLTSSAISAGLQYGTPLEDYVDKFIGSVFEPSGKVTNHSHITMATSPLDFAMQELARYYLNRTDLIDREENESQA